MLKTTLSANFHHANHRFFKFRSFAALVKSEVYCHDFEHNDYNNNY